jgi:hypothetical protein
LQKSLNKIISIGNHYTRLSLLEKNYLKIRQIRVLRECIISEKVTVKKCTGLLHRDRSVQIECIVFAIYCIIGSAGPWRKEVMKSEPAAA